jgi:hypothetical protein
MLTKVTIFVEFPRGEFKKIPLQLSKEMSLNYQKADEILCLGTITDLSHDDPLKIEVSLEVRKDETPLWYVKEIIKAAEEREILVMRNGDCLSSKGKITHSNVDKTISDDAIVTPFVAVLLSDV